MEDRRLMTRVVRYLQDNGSNRWFRCAQNCNCARGIREALGGRCAHVATALQTLVPDSVVVRGTYHGNIELYSDGPWWHLAEEFVRHGYHRHSWVETATHIYDATWWAFLPKAPVSVYIFPKPDARYRTDIKVAA